MLKYEKTNWVDGTTILRASHMEKIEKGITDIISENNAIYTDEDTRKANEQQRQQEHLAKMNEVDSIVSDIQKDYDNLQKVIIDENVSVNLQNQIKEVSSQITQIVNKNDLVVNIKDFGAKGDGVTDDTIAIKEAIEYCNNKFSINESYISQIQNKGSLLFPGGLYLISDTLHITGNYNVDMLGGVRYIGESNKTFIKIGNDNDYITGCDYILNGGTQVKGVIAFELVNLLSCNIRTKKITGFDEALRCIGKNSNGFCGNDFSLGHFYNNAIDIHLTIENYGWPNANKFNGGFFYKENNMPYEQNCVKLSSLDGTGTIDTNFFDGCNFENGKPNAIPIKIEVGSRNKFTNIRVENASNYCLAYVHTGGNLISTRGVYDSSEKCIGHKNQQGLMIEENELQLVYNSGNLGNCTATSQGDRFYHNSVTFGNIHNRTKQSSISDTNLFIKKEDGLLFNAGQCLIITRLKTNKDNIFRVVPNKDDNYINFGVRCYDYDMNPLPLEDDSIDVDGWGCNKYIKTGYNSPFMFNTNIPYSNTGSYTSPQYTMDSIVFETHEDVCYLDIYLYYAFAGDTTKNNVLVRDISVFSDNGTSQYVDASEDRHDYIVLGQNLYSFSVEDGSLKLTNV